MSRFGDQLKGGDLRSIGKVDQVVAQIKDQDDFNELFAELFNDDRKVVMRAADAIEKITIEHPGYLRPYKDDIIALSKGAKDKELKWHLALLLPRLDLTAKEVAECWQILSACATDRYESRIVRVNSIQGLFQLSARMNDGRSELDRILDQVEQENIPSITARIRKLRGK